MGALVTESRASVYWMMRGFQKGLLDDVGFQEWSWSFDSLRVH